MAESASRLSRLLDRNLAILTDQPGPPLVVGATFMAIALIRATLFPGTGGDDGEQLIFSQFFAWGYQVRNPPLYTWLVMAVSEVTGPNLWAVNIVKFTLLAGMYLMLWRAALYVIRDRRLAALAGLAPMLFYYVAWEAVTGFSHTVLVACLYAAVFWLLLCIRDAGGHWCDYLLFGAVIGLGAMAKYSFWIFLLALLAATLTDSELRRRLLSMKILAALIVAALIAAPHYLWLADRLDILAGQAGGTAAAKASLSFKGLGHGAKAAVGFLAPFWVIALACFPKAFRSISGVHPVVRVIGWQMVVIMSGTALGALLLPEFRIRTHYMIVLLLFPIWALARAEAAGASANRIRAFAVAVTVALTAAPVGLIAKYALEPLTCVRCQHHIPYADLAEKIRDMGFTGGTIVAQWHPDPLPGNLRAAFPNARVVSTKHGDVIPALRPDAGGQCLVVWSGDANRDGRSPAVGGANQLLNAGIGLDQGHQIVSAPLAGIPAIVGGKTAVLGVILTPGRGDCR